jgi:two-component system, cell cycle response regulator
MTARILVVDDNPLNVKLLAAKLAHDYYVVTTADNGQTALEKAKTDKPDLILLDVMMPEMDGFQACQKIRDDPAIAHIPIIMVTALSDVADRVRGLKAGADDFLTKPINDIALMARVRSLLRLKMIMDEWRLREATSREFLTPVPAEEPLSTSLNSSGVLLLEDNFGDQLFIKKTLESMAVKVTTTQTVADTTAEAQQGKYDLVFASVDLKNEDGLYICPQLRTQESTRQIPILLIANDSEISRVAKGLDLGANDYLMRPLDMHELLARTRTQLRHKRHYERLRKNYENSLALSLVDPMTGAFNRRYLEAHLPKMMARSESHLKPLAALMIDVDHFKQFNDSYGHDQGDIVLKAVARTIMNSLRPSDLVVRMGGEEFAAIMPETDLAVALRIGERLRERVAAMDMPSHDPDKPLNVTISIGGAWIKEVDTDVTVDSLLKRADAALYQAKNTGRNRVIGDGGEVPSNDV